MYFFIKLFLSTLLLLNLIACDSGERLRQVPVDPAEGKQDNTSVSEAEKEEQKEVSENEESQIEDEEIGENEQKENEVEVVETEENKGGSGGGKEVIAKCSFQVQTGWADKDGDGVSSDPVYTTTHVKPVYRIVPTATAVRRGDDATLDVEISSADNCGKVALHHFAYYVSDESGHDPNWVVSQYKEGIQAELVDVTTGSKFPPSPVYMNTPEDKRIAFYWGDLTTLVGYDAVIQPQIIDEKKLFRLKWKISEHMQENQQLYFFLMWTGWEDVESNTVINFDYSPMDQGGVMVTVN